jgi:hypothetical protein
VARSRLAAMAGRRVRRKSLVEGEEAKRKRQPPEGKLHSRGTVVKRRVLRQLFRVHGFW